MAALDRADAPPAIETHGLAKSFGRTPAVRGVDLAVPRGCVYGFLGPNGAGKTTTIRMLATLTRPDAGTATVLGHDLVREPGAVRRLIGLTSQFASLDQDLTGYENLVILGRLLGLPWRRARHRARDLLDMFELNNAGGRAVNTLSGGMRRRLDIAASLIAAVDLLFLDEPTTGLDPHSRRQVWSLIRAIVDRGTTVFLTTQDLNEADQLAERIAVIDQGRVIAEGTSAELKSAVGAGRMRVRVGSAQERPAAAQLVAQSLGIDVHADADPRSMSALVTGDAPDAMGQALLALARAEIAVSDFSFGQPSLDEAFLTLTGRPIEPIDETNEGEVA